MPASATSAVLPQRLNKPPIRAKAVLVLGGYVAAFLLALCSVWLNDVLADPVDGAASAGMQSFGDFVLFIAVFGVLAAFPTALGVLFLHKALAAKMGRTT